MRPVRLLLGFIRLPYLLGAVIGLYFFRASKRFPGLFLLFTLFETLLGVARAAWLWPEHPPFILFVCITGIALFGGLSIWCVVTVFAGEWDNACDRRIAELEAIRFRLRPINDFK
jgi:hypothetical protein